MTESRSSASPQLKIVIVMKRLLTVALLTIVFGFSAVVVMYLSLRGRTIAVPNVIGKTKETAEVELGGIGLRIKVIGSADESAATKVIVDQIPEAGKTVKTGQQVRVSLGPNSSPSTSEKK